VIAPFVRPLLGSTHLRLTREMNMELAKWILGIFWREKCTHPRAMSRKWLEEGTPMIESFCPDCGWRDLGHVYADPNTWIQ
jgi:hypothetical protein